MASIADAPPAPSSALSLSGAQSVAFAAAVVDYAQPEFAAADVLVDKSVPAKGWAVGGQTGQAHTLGLGTKSPMEIAAGSKLIVTIEYAYKTPKLTLGRFRLSTSRDERAMQSASTPPAVIDALRVPAAERFAKQSELIRRHFEAVAPELVAVRGQIAALNKQIAGDEARHRADHARVAPRQAARHQDSAAGQFSRRR